MRRRSTLRKFRLDRAELQQEFAEALTRVHERPVLLVGAPGSGRRSLTESARLGDRGADERGAVAADCAVRVLHDSEADRPDRHRSTTLLARLERSLADGEAVVACVTPAMQRRIAAAGLVGEFASIAVPLLTREETTRMVSGLLGVLPSARLATETWRCSGGLPSLLAPLLEHGLSTGAIQREQDTAHLLTPLTLADAAGLPTPADQLRPSELDALRRLALVEPAPPALLARLVEPAILDTLEDLGLARSDPAQGSRPATVWIPAQAVAKQLRASASAEFASEVFRTVLRTPEPRVPAPWHALGSPRSLLWWFEQGDTVPPVEAPTGADLARGRPDTVNAAAVANRAHQYRVAERLCSYALASPDTPAEERPRLLRERAYARRYGGDPESALDDLTELYRSTGDVEAAIRISEILHYERGEPAEALAFLESAMRSRTTDGKDGASPDSVPDAPLAATPAPATDEQGLRLHAALIARLAYSGRFAECMAAQRQLAPASVHLRGRADLAYAMVEAQQGDALAALRSLSRYSAGELNDVPEWFAEELQGALFVCMLHAYGPERTRGTVGTLGGGDPAPFLDIEDASVLTARTGLLLASGHLREARVVAVALASDMTRDRSGIGGHAIALGAEAAAYTGDTATSLRLEQLYRRAARGASALLWTDAEVALCAAALGRGEPSALQRSRELASTWASQGLHGAALRAAHVGLRAGDLDSARIAGASVPHTTGPAHGAIAYHAAALIDRDPAALRDAAERYLELGFALYAAEAFAQAATYSREAQLTDLAKETAGRATLLLAALGDTAAPHLQTHAARGGPGLTDRERQVAQLAARGSSNRDIAATLSVSVRTVEGHLRRSYAKLGVSARDHLAEHPDLAEAADSSPQRPHRNRW